MPPTVTSPHAAHRATDNASPAHSLTSTASRLSITHEYLFEQVPWYRAAARKAVLHPAFEGFVGLAILASTGSLVFTDEPARLAGVPSHMNSVSVYVDYVVLAAFLLEFVVRVASYGLMPLPEWLPRILRPDKRVRVLEGRSHKVVPIDSSEHAPKRDAEATDASILTDDLEASSKQYYFASGWNRLGFALILITAWSIYEDYSSLRVAGARALRALQPLRAIRFIPAFHVILKSIWRAMRTLVDVSIFLCFMYLFFALMGQQMYQGSLLRRCVVPAGDDALRFDVSSPLHTELMRNLSQSVAYAPTQYTVYQPTTYCSLASAPKSFSCADVGVSPIVAVSTAAGSAVFVQVPLVCVVTDTNPAQGYVNFDNVGAALWSVLTVSTFAVSALSFLFSADSQLMLCDTMYIAVHTAQNWDLVLFGLMDAEYSVPTAFFCVATIVVIAFLSIQLFTSALCSSSIQVRCVPVLKFELEWKEYDASCGL